MSSWINHVKHYASENDMNYAEALKSTKCKQTYQANKQAFQKRKLAEQEGEGLKDIYNSIKTGVSNIKTGVSNIIKSPTTALTVRPKVVSEMLAKYGQNTITNIEVCRQPIMNVIRGALDLASGGDLSKVVKEKGYDNVFHLFCIITLNDKTRIRIDKNQRVTIVYNPAPLTNAVTKSVKLPELVTLNTFIEKGEVLGNKIGSFYRYNGATDNCQRFIRVLLNASGVTSMDSFIQQDTQNMIKPGLLRSITQTVTDGASLLDYAYKGGKR